MYLGQYLYVEFTKNIAVFGMLLTNQNFQILINVLWPQQQKQTAIRLNTTGVKKL